jgi:hypothetical protein
MDRPIRGRSTNGGGIACAFEWRGGWSDSLRCLKSLYGLPTRVVGHGYLKVVE